MWSDEEIESFFGRIDRGIDSIVSATTRFLEITILATLFMVVGTKSGVSIAVIIGLLVGCIGVIWVIKGAMKTVMLLSEYVDQKLGFLISCLFALIAANLYGALLYVIVRATITAFGRVEFAA